MLCWEVGQGRQEGNVQKKRSKEKGKGKGGRA